MKIHSYEDRHGADPIRRALRLKELRQIINKHGYDGTGLARLTEEERCEFLSLGGTTQELYERHYAHDDASHLNKSASTTAP